MKADTEKNQYIFLEDGGEMGEMIKSYDWSTSVLGTPDKWPPSLCTTLGIILHSAFPMFLFWGKDLICFYNDAFRPSLGIDGKHPGIGKKGIEVWDDIWEFVGPMIKGVMETGKPVYFEDQLIGFYRNGKKEDIYWTFSYSPAYGDNNKINGVFVTCTETTGKIQTIKALGESEQRFRTMAESTDVLIATSDETSNATYFNKAWTDFTGRSVNELLDFGWADLVHEEDRQNFLDIYLDAFKKQQTWTGQFRMLNKAGEYRWLIANGPVRKTVDGTFAGYISSSTDITDQVNALKKTEDSEQDLRGLVLQAPIGICVLNADLVSEIVNDSFIEIAGKPYEQIAGKYYWDTFAEARPYYEDALNKVIKEGIPYYANEVELMLIRHGREENIYVTFVYSPLKDAEGKVKKVAVWVLENTQQVTSRQKVEQSELEIRSLVEAAPFPIGVYKGREMRVAFANKSIMDIWGKGNDVIGKLFSEVLPELDNQEVFKQLDEVYRTGIAFHIKNQPLDLIVDGKSHTYYFNYSLTPLFDAAGKVYGVMNTGVDLTELNLAKRKIEESEKNLRNTILQAPVAMCILRGPQFVVEIANEFMFELWGRPGNDILHKPIFEGLPEAKEQGFETLLEEVYTSGKTFIAEAVPTKLPRKGKIETIYINFVYEAYHEADGTISGILAVATDVTAQVLARQKIEEIVSERTRELAEANSSLQRSNAELAQFAYIASHDLQEPLRKIGTFSQMLEKSLGDNLNEQSKKYFSKIQLSANRMNSLIRDVLTYSEVTKENDHFENVDLNKIVDNIIADYDLLIEQTGASLKSSDLPVLEAIPLQMSQLFGNLIGNALKFIRKDEKPVITITASRLSAEEKKGLSLSQVTDFYNIQFKDNGVGFNPEYADKIFHIFQRLHRKSEFEGTGIGLAMCKKIALNHQGDINASGSSENGAVFNVILPVKQVK
ncbi:MAG: rcsC [Bacteroidetes bacterium]|nr:rcsC [Bacteroidota bacterium]